MMDDVTVFAAIDNVDAARASVGIYPAPAGPADENEARAGDATSDSTEVARLSSRKAGTLRDARE